MEVGEGMEGVGSSNNRAMDLMTSVVGRAAVLGMVLVSGAKVRSSNNSPVGYSSRTLARAAVSTRSSQVWRHGDKPRDKRLQISESGERQN